MPVEGAGGCCKFLVATEARKDGGVASGVLPGPRVLGRGIPPKKELEVGRGVLGRGGVCPSYVSGALGFVFSVTGLLFSGGEGGLFQVLVSLCH